jgi:magnesium transporter
MIETRVDGRTVDLPSPERIAAWSAKDGVLWLDVAAPDDADLDFLTRALHLHPLVVEDLQHRNQRPKVDDYPNLLFVVLFGAVESNQSHVNLCEVHIILSDNRVPAIADLWGTCDKRPEIGHGSPQGIFHRLCDALVDSVFPILDETDDEIDRVENNIIERADETTVADIFRLKRDLNSLRRILAPERDLLQTLSGPRVQRLDAEAQLYLRDVYDHAVRMVEQVDSYRDIITGALDVYLSSVSNRLGEQTKRLTLVATIFLPLTFLTGFFGMNFGALVSSISSTKAFVVAVVAMALSVPLVYVVTQRFTARAQALPPRRTRRLGVRPYTRRVHRHGDGGTS